MAFYVQKSLASGPIRFGVSPRRSIEEIDSDPGLSTGPKGELAGRSKEGFFFAGAPAPIGAPQLPTEKSISSMPFWSSLRPDGTPRRWGFLALLIAGALLVLLGFGVVANKGPQGWLEIVLGAAMIATPIVLTAQERRKIREREELERAEREERERRHRDMLSSYATALETLRAQVNEETLRSATREREALDIPYEIWSPVARQTALAIGFDALGSLTPARAGEVADQMRRAAAAAGLTAEDEAAARQAIYRSALWHLLADDRLGEPQRQQLERLRNGLGLSAADTKAEDDAAGEFGRLRGVTRDNLPRQECPFPVGFREYCILVASGHTLKLKRDRKSRTETFVPDRPCRVFLTNKRLIVDAQRRVEVGLVKIDDVEIDADANVLTIRTADPDHPIRLQLTDSFYAAALIDIATTIDERPKSFAQVSR